ncbi:MAG: MATE family efflux transporter [Blautia sp.]|nr:MATE family efflux transporter [Blautia sp.]
MQDKKYETEIFYQKLLHLGIPISLQSLMLASVAAGDAVMLGHIAQDQMTAVSLATQVQFIQNMIIMSVTGAGSILGAQYWGKGDHRTLEDIFSMILRLCGLVSIAFFIACEFFPRYLMLIFTNEPILAEIGIGYLRIAGWSYLMTGISQCYLTMMKVTDHAARCAWISSSAVVINIVLNAVFIFGLFGVPAMEAKGAALATLLARTIELCWSFITSFQKGYVHPRASRFFYRNRLLSKDFRKCCLPLLGASLFWGVGFTSYTAIMGHMGSDAAAANSVTAVIRDLLCCVCNGVSAAGGIMVGYELGAGDLKRGKAYGDRLMKLSFALGFAGTLVVLSIIPIVTRLITLTPKAQKYFVGMMVIMAVYMIGRVVNTIIINGIFASGGDTLFDVYSLAVCMWGLAIPLALLGAFVFHWHVFAVYACTCLDEVGKIPWVMFHYKKYIWVKDLTRTF